MKKLMITCCLLSFILFGCKTTKELQPQQFELRNNVEVIDFNNLKVTNQELYDIAKVTYGYGAILDIVDRDLFSGFEAQIDSEKLENYAQDQLRFFANGDRFVLSRRVNETELEYQTRIKDFYKIDLLKEASAIDKAKKSVDVKKAVNEYREDVCVITVEFDDIIKTEKFLSTVKLLSDKALEDHFKINNNADIGQFLNNKQTDIDDSYLSSQINCDYERLTFENFTNTDIRDFIFDEINLHDYNKKPFIYKDNYYLFYKIGKANLKQTYDQEKFEKVLTEKLIKPIVTKDYIYDHLDQLRKESNLVIYDSKITNKYNNSSIAAPDKYTVATYNGKNITTDEIFAKIKVQAVLSYLNLIDHSILVQNDDIKLTETELDQVNDQLKSMKTQFLNLNDINQSWEEYLTYYGVKTDEGLKHLLQLDILTKRYLLGYSVDNIQKWKGVYPILDQEVKQMYNDWFDIKASHILFKIEEDATEAEKKLVNLKTKQVILGYNSLTQDEIAIFNNDEFIRYDYNGDGELGLPDREITKALSGLTGEQKEMKRIELEEYFLGLDHTNATVLKEIFRTLATNYSDDFDSKRYGGSLGNFGPERMVKEFELAAKNLVQTNTPYSNYSDDYTLGDTLALTNYGYHVIIASNNSNKPDIPQGYENKTIDEVRQELIRNSNPALKNYYDFIINLETALINKHLSYNNVNKYMALLRNEYQFKFNDEELQKIYTDLNNFYINN